MMHALAHAPVLIIEDDSATLEFLDVLLRMSGYQVHTAASGESGLIQATSAPIAAILLDRRLPDADGVTLCATLRDRLGPQVPIIVLTADHNPGLEAAGRAAGATAFLRKPFQPDVLLQHLDTLIRNAPA